MAEIKQTRIAEENLTIFSVSGAVTKEEIVGTLKDYYAKGQVSRNFLWDFSQADLQDARSEDVEAVASFGSIEAKPRAGGKTAIVGPDDLVYGLGRMYQSMATLRGIPVQLEVFRDEDEARAWIAE